MKVTQVAASPDGTTMPPSSALIDSEGAAWTLVDGFLYRNGVNAGNNYDTALAAYYGVVYCCNTAGQWYRWDGTGWQHSDDPSAGGPLPPPTSQNGATIPPETQLVDKVGGIVTVVDGVIYRNGAPMGHNSDVSLVLWYGGKFYCCNTSASWYVNADVKAQWLLCTDPRLPAAAAPGYFHGINGHHDYLYTPDEIVQIMRDLGCSIYRCGVTQGEDHLHPVRKLAEAFQREGLTFFALISHGVFKTHGEMWPDEETAYQEGHKAARTVAAELKPFGVKFYECGNELTREPGIIVDLNYAGTNAKDWHNHSWPILRGTIRGMIDGVKSVDPDALCGVNFCVNDVGASDALWDGSAPDGSSGHPLTRWDITTWHNYQVYGDIFNIGADGAGPGFDLSCYVKARYGKPFIMTEWNTGPEKSTEYRADYITRTGNSYFAARKTHNFQTSMLYCLDSGNETYGIMIDGVPVPDQYDAFVSFVADNPDN